MKVWAKKDAVIASTKSLRIVGWAEKHNAWIEGACQLREYVVGDDILKVRFQITGWSTIELGIPIEQMNIDICQMQSFLKGQGGVTVEEFLQIRAIVEKKY